MSSFHSLIYSRSVEFLFGIMAGLIALAAPTLAADLPKATQKVLKELKLKSSVLEGIEAELAVPQAILEGARKEGKVVILGSWSPKEFRALSAPFKERYPFINVEYSYGRAFNARAMKPIIAYKEGRYIADAVTGFGGARRLYKEADALTDLRDLPGFKNPIDGNDPAGGWAAIRLRFWCMVYNTKKVNKADLPKTWEDLLTNSAWHGGKIGVANRPQLWLLMLRGKKGKQWTEDYIDRFFTQVKPQIRKEGLNAMITLTAAGELWAAIPSGPSRVATLQEKGAPVGWHCPLPIPRATSRTAILKGGPHVNAAKLWANWLISKEGQVTQFFAEGTAPSHRGLQMRELLSFSDQILGREQVGEPAQYLKEVKAMWNKHWKEARTAK